MITAHCTAVDPGFKPSALLTSGDRSFLLGEAEGAVLPTVECLAACLGLTREDASSMPL